MTTCANCGGTAFYQDDDPMDLHGTPDLVCVKCARVYGVTLRLGDLPDPRPSPSLSSRVAVCQHCGKEFSLTAKHRGAQQFCGKACGYAGRSVHPRKERSA